MVNAIDGMRTGFNVPQVPVSSIATRLPILYRTEVLHGLENGN